MDTSALPELVRFLGHAKPEVQRVALEAVLPYTVPDKGQTFLFKKDDYAAVRALKSLAAKPDTESHALSALINLSQDADVCEFLADDRAAMLRYSANVAGGARLPRLYSMLLVNLGHSDNVVALLGDPLLALVNKFAASDAAELDHLSLLFSESARRPGGPRFWAERADFPLGLLHPQLHAASLVRRAGVAATIKNTLFEAQAHPQLAASDLIEHIMIALKGPEEMPHEQDRLELPEAVRDVMGPAKRREDDMQVVCVLLESLLLLSCSVEGRAALREKHAYYVVREVDAALKNDAVSSLCQRYVDQLFRGEPEQAHADADVVEVV